MNDVYILNLIFFIEYNLTTVIFYSFELPVVTFYRKSCKAFENGQAQQKVKSFFIEVVGNFL